MSGRTVERERVCQLHNLLCSVSQLRSRGYYVARDGDDERSYTVYVLEVESFDRSWKVYRRYSHFLHLRELLSHTDPLPRRLLLSLSAAGREDHLRARSRGLVQWLNQANDELQGSCMDAMHDAAAEDCDLAPLAAEAFLLLDFLRRDPDCPPPCATGDLPAWAQPDNHSPRSKPASGLRGATARDVVLPWLALAAGDPPAPDDALPPSAAGAHPILAERRSIVSAKRAWEASAAALSGVLDETGQSGDDLSAARLDALGQDVRRAAAQAESALRLLVSSLVLGSGERGLRVVPGEEGCDRGEGGGAAWPAAWAGPPSPPPVERHGPGEAMSDRAQSSQGDPPTLHAAAATPLRRRRRSSSFALASSPQSSRGPGLRASRSTPHSLSALDQTQPPPADDGAVHVETLDAVAGAGADGGNGGPTGSDEPVAKAPPPVLTEREGGAAAPDGAVTCLSPTPTAAGRGSAAPRSPARPEAQMSPSPSPIPPSRTSQKRQAPSAWPHPHVVAWARPWDHCDWLLARFTSQQRARFSLPTHGSAFAPRVGPQLRAAVCGRAPHADAVPALQPRMLSPFVGVSEVESGFLLTLDGHTNATEGRGHSSGPVPPSPLHATSGHGLLAYLTDRGEVLGVRGTLPFPAVTAARPLLLHRLYRGHRVVAVASGQNHAVAVTEDGCLFTWGSGEHGCLGHGGTADQRDPRLVEALAGHRVRAAACGGSHTVCCTEQGLIFAWGRAADGRLGTGISSQPSVDLPIPVRHEAWKRLAVVAVACGWSHTAAVSADGALWAWGAGQGGTDASPEAVTSPRRVPLGPSPASGTLDPAACGGTSLLGDASTQAVLVRCGFAHSMALAADGTLWAWGEGGQGELGLGPDVQRVATAHLVPLPPGASPPEDRVVEVQCGLHHTVALTATGRVFAWGHGQGGVLGTGDEQSRPWPEWVTGAPPAVRTAACTTTSTLLLAAPGGEVSGDNDTGAAAAAEADAPREYRVPSREGATTGEEDAPDDVGVVQACTRVFAHGESPDATFRSAHRVAPGACLAQDEAGLAEVAAAAAAGAAMGGLALDDVAPSVPGLYVRSSSTDAPSTPGGSLLAASRTAAPPLTPTHSVSSLSVAHGIDATGALERPSTPEVHGSAATEAATPSHAGAAHADDPSTERSAPRSRSGSSELREWEPAPSPAQKQQRTTELCGFAERPGTAVADTSRFEKSSLGAFRAFTAADFARWAVGVGAASTMRQGLRLLARLHDTGLVSCLDAAGEGVEAFLTPQKKRPGETWLPFSGEPARAAQASTADSDASVEDLWRRYRFAVHETAAGAAATLTEGALLLALTAHLLRTVEVKNRSYRLRSARRCFVPSEAVASLVGHGLARTAEEAARRCNALLDVGLLEAVVPRNSGSLRRDAATRFHQTHGCFYRVVPHLPAQLASSQAAATGVLAAERELEQHWREDLLPKLRSQRDLSSVFRGWRRGLPPSVRGEAWQELIGNVLLITHPLWRVLSRRARLLMQAAAHRKTAGDGGDRGDQWREERREEARRRVRKFMARYRRKLIQARRRRGSGKSGAGAAEGSSGEASGEDGSVLSREGQEVDSYGGDEEEEDYEDDEDDEENDEDDEDVDDAAGGAVALVEELASASQPAASSPAGTSPTAGQRSGVGAWGPLGKEKSIELVDQDLARTLPALGVFDQGSALAEDLRSVLFAFVCYRPDVGYMQGMSYVVAPFVIHCQDRYAAFVCAANLLVRVHFLDFFLLRTRRVARYMFLFERYLEDVAKPVHEVLHGHGINPELYLFNWFQMVFFQVLPFPLACRVWDLFLLEGTQVLYRTAAAILLCLHPALVGAPFDRCMLLLTRSGGMAAVWERLITPDSLMRQVEVLVAPQWLRRDIAALEASINAVAKAAEASSD